MRREQNQLGQMIQKLTRKGIQISRPNYLIQMGGGGSKEISKRIANSWKAFWVKKFILKSKIKLGTKVRIFERCAIPVLSYGSQEHGQLQGSKFKS